MRAQQQVAGVVGGQVIAAGVGVGVMRVERALPGQRLIEIGALAGRLVSASAARIMAAKSDARPGNSSCAGAPGMAEPVAVASCCCAMKSKARAAMREPCRLVRG